MVVNFSRSAKWQEGEFNSVQEAFMELKHRYLLCHGVSRQIGAHVLVGKHAEEITKLLNSINLLNRGRKLGDLELLKFLLVVSGLTILLEAYTVKAYNKNLDTERNKYVSNLESFCRPH